MRNGYKSAKINHLWVFVCESFNGGILLCDLKCISAPCKSLAYFLVKTYKMLNPDEGAITLKGLDAYYYI